MYTHQTSIPETGFEPTITASEGEKTVHALDRSATVTGKITPVQTVEAPTFSGIRLTDGVKVVSPTHRPVFTTRKISDTHFC
jgi:hypothetical protein